MLLHRYGPYCFTDKIGKTHFKLAWVDDGTVSINARRPISTQLAKFPALGWGPSPPTWRELVHCMTSRAIEEYAFDRRQPGNRHKKYPMTAAAFFRECDNYLDSEDGTREDDGDDDAFIDPEDFCDHHSSEAGGAY